MVLKRLCSALLLCVLADAGIAADKLFRYKDAEGRVVINHTLPPELVTEGYEILSASGQLLEVVPRTLSAEELANLSEEEQLQRKQDAQKEAQLAYDESLLLRYSDISDIEAARDRALREFSIRISILKGNQIAIKRNVEREQEQAANIERSGRKVPELMSDNLKALQEELRVTEESILLRESELEDVRASYQSDMDRFEVISKKFGSRR
jgi:hypothetical protein